MIVKIEAGQKQKMEEAPDLVWNNDIDERLRLWLFRTQSVIRQAAQRAYDLFLQKLVKGTRHLSTGQEVVAVGFAGRDAAAPTMPPRTSHYSGVATLILTPNL